MEGISAGTAFVAILPNTAGFGTKLDAQMGPQLNKTQSRLSKFKGVAALAFVGAGAAAIKFGADSVTAARESEQATSALQQALGKSPLLIGATTAEFQTQATALEHLSGVQDEEILGADTILSRFALTAAQIKETTPLVLDYAQATGKDVPTSANLVAKALLGNTKALKTIGIDYHVTGDKATDLANIQQLLTDKVGGTAAAFGKTSAGKIAIFQAKLDDLKETIGNALIPVLNAVTTVLSAILDAFSSLPGPVQKIIVGVGLLGGAFVVTGIALGVLRKSMRGFTGDAVKATVATGAEIVAVEGLTVAEGELAVASKLAGGGVGGVAGVAGKTGAVVEEFAATTGVAAGGLSGMAAAAGVSTGAAAALLAGSAALGYGIGTLANHVFGISDKLDRLLVPSLDTSAQGMRDWNASTSGAIDTLKAKFAAGTISMEEFSAGVDAVNEATGTGFSARGLINAMQAAKHSADSTAGSLAKVQLNVENLANIKRLKGWQVTKAVIEAGEKANWAQGNLASLHSEIVLLPNGKIISITLPRLKDVQRSLRALHSQVEAIAGPHGIEFSVVYNKRDLVPVGGGQVHFAEGGIIPEPVVGIGTRSGKRYTFAEHGPETVVPHGAASGGASMAAAGRDGGTWHVTINEARDPRRVLAELRMERAIRGW